MLLLFPALTQTSTYHTFLIAQLQYLSHSLHYIITQTSSLPTYLIACITLNKPVLISLSALHNYTTQYLSYYLYYIITLTRTWVTACITKITILISQPELHKHGNNVSVCQSIHMQTICTSINFYHQKNCGIHICFLLH